MSVDVEATGRRGPNCGKPVMAHTEEYVNEVPAETVQAHATDRAVQDKRPPRQMRGG